MITLNQKLMELKAQNQIVKDAFTKLDDEKKKLARMFQTHFDLDVGRNMELVDMIDKISEITKRNIELERLAQ